MIRSRLGLLLILGLAGCAAPALVAGPICDGKARRPANPHGSVLNPSALPLASTCEARR